MCTSMAKCIKWLGPNVERTLVAALCDIHLDTDSRSMSKPLLLFVGLGLPLVLSACSPRVAVEVPKEPITINLNVKIDHEVRVKVDKELEKVLSKNSGLF